MDNKLNFDDTIAYINKKLDNNTDNQIILQKNILNSSDMNKTFSYIESSLNFLYEKSRLLEDLIQYTDSYLKSEIVESISECKSLINTISNNRDVIKNNSYIKYNVPFVISNSNYLDRNNNTISNASLYNNKITLHDNVYNTYVPDACISDQPYAINNINNNLDTIIDNNSYRTAYMFKTIIGDAITETITFLFNSPITLNKINYLLSNCSVQTIQLTLDNDDTYVVPNNYELFKKCVVKRIDITLECKTFIKSQIDYNKYKGSNFWMDINADQNLTLDIPNYYYYIFGIDNIQFQNIKTDRQSCFVSNEIKIDSIKDNEYLTLNVIDSVERGNIEYYIIDGTEEIPVCPENITTIRDEKIFHKISPRFTINRNYPIIIKKNGTISNLQLTDVINKDDDNTYTISYTPTAIPIKSLKNNSIKIKAILRSYDENFHTFIKEINIKKYGGGKLWIDRI